MIYSEKILGKPLRELELSDIKQFFSNTRNESDILEFKSFDNRGKFNDKLKGIYKGLCALLNSEGGILIWGAPSGKVVEGKKEKEFTGDLNLIDKTFEQDSLVNLFSDNITPVPRTINVQIIEDEGKSLIIFEVEKSSYSPHQTNNTYYMRLDGQSRPAPHHYVEALFNQIKYPDLGGYVKFNKIVVNGDNILLGITIVIVNHSPLLNEENISFSLMTTKGSIINQAPEKLDLQNQRLRIQEFEKILHYGGVPFYDVVISFLPHDIQGEKIKLILTYGGRKSPMKHSEYEISLENYYPKNINDVVLNYSENNLMADIGKDKGTEQEKVNIFLKRNRN